MQNSVFLRTLPYDGTACSQKTENAKTAVGSMPTAVFFSLTIIKNETNIH